MCCIGIIQRNGAVVSVARSLSYRGLSQLRRMHHGSAVRKPGVRLLVGKSSRNARLLGRLVWIFSAQTRDQAGDRHIFCLTLSQQSVRGLSHLSRMHHEGAMRKPNVGRLAGRVREQVMRMSF